MPADWLFFAESDLEAITRLAADEIGYYLCLSKLAEVVEKILKAELLRLGWFLQRTHDLPKLADELSQRGSELESRVRPLVESLADCYIIGRYPGFDLEDPDWPEFRRQLEMTSALLALVRRGIEPSSPAG